MEWALICTPTTMKRAKTVDVNRRCGSMDRCRLTAQCFDLLLNSQNRTTSLWEVSNSGKNLRLCCQGGTILPGRLR
jgi:hypothetical protein